MKYHLQMLFWMFDELDPIEANFGKSNSEQKHYFQKDIIKK